MINWVILIVLIVLMFMLFKARHFKHRIYLVVLIILLVFFYTTTSRIINENNIDVGTFDGMVVAGKLYLSWLGHIFGNLKTISGEAIGMDWIGNSTLK